MMRGILKKPKSALDQANMTTDFEVRCDHCAVSYPIGTKRCMYCGGRPGHRPLFARQISIDPLGEIEFLDGTPEPENSVRELGAPVFAEGAEGTGDEEEVEPGRSSVFRLFGNLSWIILFALLTLYRACTG
jgi:hypothetical protein